MIMVGLYAKTRLAAGRTGGAASTQTARRSRAGGGLRGEAGINYISQVRTQCAAIFLGGHICDRHQLYFELEAARRYRRDGAGDVIDEDLFRIV